MLALNRLFDTRRSFLIACYKCGELFADERAFAAHHAPRGWCAHPPGSGMTLKMAGSRAVWAPADDGQCHD
jgi:hypothetical protein